MINAVDFIKDAEDIFKMKEVVIVSDFGKEYKININSKIKDSDIAKIVNELNKNSMYCSKKKKEYDVVADMYAILIKRFTDIQFKEYKDTWKQIRHQIRVCECMIDLGIYRKIIELFDVEDIKKLQDSFAMYGKTFNQINNRLINQELNSQKEQTHD